MGNETPLLQSSSLAASVYEEIAILAALGSIPTKDVNAVASLLETYQVRVARTHI